jgi:hypothetical protein
LRFQIAHFETTIFFFLIIHFEIVILSITRFETVNLNGLKMSQFVCRYKMGNMGVQQAEPRLEPKKHRRKSRKSINQSILDELDELEDDDDDLEVEK